MSFAAAARIADSVLYEGYLLYPYRASAAKNRVRWQFGVVAPREYSEATEESDPWFLGSNCLLEHDESRETASAARPVIDIRVRCLHVQARTIEIACETGVFARVPAVTIGDRQLVEWDEGVERTIDVCDLSLDALLERERVIPIRIEPGVEVENMSGGPGAVRLVRTRLAIDGSLRVAAERCGRFIRVRLRVENTTTGTANLDDRDRAIRQAMVGTHLMIAARGARFVSVLEPPDEAIAAVAACVNVRAWPVLVGSREQRDTLLIAPIILYDYPSVAPESPGELFDGTEIDEILSLRVMTLTDEEKQEARATDARAAAIVDRVDAMSADALSSLHGTWRELLNPPDRPAPEDDAIEIAGVRVGRGSRVRIDPQRRADPIDIIVRGRAALVQGIYRDLEDRVHVAVVLADDPAGELHASYGRFMYYGPEELIPLEDA